MNELMETENKPEKGEEMENLATPLPSVNEPILPTPDFPIPNLPIPKEESIKMPSPSIFTNHKRTILIILSVFFVFSLSANGAAAYFISTNKKTIADKQADIVVKDKTIAEQKTVIDNQSNCPVVAPVVEAPASTTPAPATTYKKSTSSSSSAQEEVIMPPAPPSDN